MLNRIKAALIVDDNDFHLDDVFLKFNQEENIELKILKKGQGRINFLEKAKKLLVNNKENREFTEDDIRKLEEELDLVINITNKDSLEDSLITGLNYAEIVFIKKDLKNFSIIDYKNAVEEFKKRKRNFGK
jgi:undecaprenyl pyrophosphate synthase